MPVLLTMLCVVALFHTFFKRKLFRSNGCTLADLSALTMPPKTSGKGAVKAGKATKAVPKGDKKKRKGKRKESYAIYIYKVRSRRFRMYALLSLVAGAEASSPRHWRVFQGHEHHEFLRQRPLRENCR